MVWRYRKTVRIAPGIRLNFTNRGMSATLGPRGSSVSFSRRGTYVNQRVPFLGLSRRIKVGAGKSGGAPAQQAPPQLALPPEAKEWWEPHRAWREAEAARTSEPAPPDERAAASRLLEACQGGLLGGRARTDVDWEAIARSGPYVPRPFTSPVSQAAERQRRAIVNALVPWTPWAFFAVAAGLLFAINGTTRVVGVLLVLVGGGRLLWDRRKRAEGLAELAAADRQLEDAAREGHEAEEEEARAAHEEGRSLAARIVAAAETGDTAPLAEVLERELANEDLPVPLEFELAFDGPSRVGLEIRLPALSLVPAAEPTTTPGGKPTTKNIGVRRRVELYRDLCAGLALRLIHETFRVLPLTKQVECWGRGPGRHPATGQLELVTALHLRLDRAAFEQLDLDHVHRSTCLSGQRGRLGVSADGALASVPGGGELATS